MGARANAALLAVLGLPLAESRGLAQEKEACAAAADQAQTQRDGGKLRAARALLASCANEGCPEAVRHGCEKGLADVDAILPTVILRARDPKGNEVTGTRVLLDGAVLVDRLDGKPIPLDPGEHALRYETSGAAPVEQHAVIRAGEKNRALTAILMPLAPAVPAPTPLAPTEKPAEPEPSSPARPVPVASIVLASVAVVAGVGFAYFGLSGTSDVSHLRATCAPNCAESDVSAARTKLVVSDVALGVGVVSLAAAAWFYFQRTPAAPSTQSAIQADVQARPGGGVATLSTRF